MDEDMSFPNPVLRTDLPVKRRRWPRVLAAGAILLVLGIAFLPQVLHTRIGRRFEPAATPCPGDDAQNALW